MTDETKQLFDAPWTVTVEEIRKDTKRFAVVKNNLDYELVAIDLTHEDAHRLARLPELYDALREQLKSFCWAHCKEDVEKILHDGCPHVGGCVTCLCTKHFDLIRKVRDGE